MARGGKQMLELKQMLSEKRQQRDILNTEIAALEALERRLLGEPESKPQRSTRSNVKQAVLDLLEETRHSGLNAGMAVEMAKAKGQTLDRGSVSSLLSRLKREGVVVHEGNLYRIPKTPPKPEVDETEPATQASDNIHPLRTSG